MTFLKTFVFLKDSMIIIILPYFLPKISAINTLKKIAFECFLMTKIFLEKLVRKLLNKCLCHDTASPVFPEHGLGGILLFLKTKSQHRGSERLTSLLVSGIDV